MHTCSFYSNKFKDTTFIKKTVTEARMTLIKRTLIVLTFIMIVKHQVVIIINGLKSSDLIRLVIDILCKSYSRIKALCYYAQILIERINSDFDWLI